MDYQELFIFIMEILGTIAFSVSGAMVGARRGMDIFGVGILGVVTAVGGGMIRDIILGITPPGMFREPVYALVAVVTACIVFGILYFHKQGAFGWKSRVAYEKVVLVMDSIGLGVFTVLGVLRGTSQGYENETFFLVFLGVTTGVGGGLLRDMMAGVPPYIFVKHIYACASIIGAIACVYLYRNLGPALAMACASAIVIIIRFLAAHYRWNLPNLSPTQNKD